jgi:hypothetical protein
MKLNKDVREREGTLQLMVSLHTTAKPSNGKCKYDQKNVTSEARVLTLTTHMMMVTKERRMVATSTMFQLSMKKSLQKFTFTIVLY